MSEPFTNPELVVYQLRVVLRGISPLIWRRLLIRGDSTIADLHRTLQVVFGWSDEHLHRFVIHGRLYDEGGLVDPRQVGVAALGLRLQERFLYEYDFIDGWQHDLRLEQILPLDSRRRYPVCSGGRRAAPPEDCGGPWAFLELRQRYSTVGIARRMLKLLSPLVTTGHDDIDDPWSDEPDEDDPAEELGVLRYWLRIDRFDRRATNRRLAQLATARVRAAA
jgi:Plasmid pRiA4b ORF-3-like protein